MAGGSATEWCRPNFSRVASTASTTFANQVCSEWPWYIETIARSTWGMPAATASFAACSTWASLIPDRRSGTSNWAW